MPMVPPAPPVRFSMNTCWPNWRERFSPTRRAMKSSPPPAARCTMKRTGRVGQSCARAVCGANSAAPAASVVAPNWRRVMVIDMSLSFLACSPDGAKRNPGPLRRIERQFPHFAGCGLRILRLIPIQNLCPIPRRNTRTAQHRLEGAAHVIDPMRHAGEIWMHRDRQDLRALGGFLVKAFEVVHHARMHLT